MRLQQDNMLNHMSRALCAIVLLALPLACGDSEERADQTSQRTPTVQVVDYAGLEAFLMERKGQPYLLNLWAIW